MFTCTRCLSGTENDDDLCDACAREANETPEYGGGTIRASDIPDEVVEAMQSCLHPLEPWVARRLAAAMINAWPGAWIGPPNYDPPLAAILPLPQKGDA